MTSPWMNTTVGRSAPEAHEAPEAPEALEAPQVDPGGVSCCTWNWTPLATTLATAAHRPQAQLNMVDDVADPQVDDLVQVLVGEEPDEVDLASVVLLHQPGQRHELDALEFEIAGEGGVHGDTDFQQVVLADDLGEHSGDVGQDGVSVHWWWSSLS